MIKNQCPLVVILMATYNGDKYVAEQIESLINQTYTNWILIIRDDGSSDETINIVNRYIQKNEKIILINNDSSEVGARANFAALYSWARENTISDYIMFCDQDDVWLPNKIEDSVMYMLKMESVHPNKPVLIYADLDLISEKGERLNTKINVLHKFTFNQIIAQNYCFGCTMLLNGPLINKIDQISDKAENHDYWVALVATAFGYPAYLNTPVILYRQHNGNVSSQGNSIKKRLNRYTKGLNKKINNLHSTLSMLIDFYNRYQYELDSAKAAMVKQYVTAFNKGALIVFVNVVKYRIFRLNVIQNIAFLFLIIKYLNTKKLLKNSL